jgi:hypothetical protein
MAYIIEGENNVNQHLDLICLHTRPRERPCTKARQIRQPWAHITELLSVAHSLTDFCGGLNEIELQIEYARASHYVGKLTRRKWRGAIAHSAQVARQTGQNAQGSATGCPSDRRSGPAPRSALANGLEPGATCWRPGS